MEILNKISQALISGNAPLVEGLTKEALSQGIDPQVIVNDSLIAGMNVIGVRFKADEIYVPEVLIAARAMHAGMNILKPLLADSKSSSIGKAIVGTVKGDLHDIGKNLVIMMLEGAGFEVIDLGINVPPEKFISAINEYKPDILGLSALLTTTIPEMKNTLSVLNEAGVRNKVKVIVGGAPVTQKYADEINADGYAPDASRAVDVAKQLIGRQLWATGA